MQDGLVLSVEINQFYTLINLIMCLVCDTKQQGQELSTPLDL